MPSKFSFDPILMGYKEEAEKSAFCACVQTGGARVEWLIPKEEMDVLEAERLVDIFSTQLAIFSRTEKEE